MTRVLHTVAVVEFYADFPDDEFDADRYADDLSYAIVAAVDALPGVADGSVMVSDLETDAHQ